MPADLPVVLRVPLLVKRLGDPVDRGQRLAEDGGFGRPGVDVRDRDAPLPELEPQCVTDRLHSEFRRAVRPVERQD